MSNELKKYCVNANVSILDAIKSIDRSGEGFAVVIDNTGKVQGVLSDGDVRRAILSGKTLEQPIKDHIQRNFLYSNEQASRAEVLDLMQARKIRHVPIVDKGGHLSGIHLLDSIIGEKELVNWAVIMAGGKGTRLYPITETIPKPMIKVAGRPILERVVLHLISHGIRRIFISVNYLAEQIESHFGDGAAFGCRIEYLKERADEPLGTAGSLALFSDMPINPVFVINGDLITDINIRGMLDFQKNGDFDLVMGLKPYMHQVPFGCVEVDGTRIIALEEKPVLQRLVNVGAYVLSPKVIKSINATFLPITSLFEQSLADGLRVGAYETDFDWIDVGELKSLKAVRGDL
jgi:dTDP-glucose pyrophosphorylase